MKEYKPKQKSKCCNASVTVCGGDGGRLDNCTFFFVCDKCKQPCDILWEGKVINRK